MRLTRYTDYSLRVLIRLATQPDGLASIAGISEAYSVSSDHMKKVVQNLAALGLVETVRGRNGGLRLARKPEEINVGALIRQTEEGFDLVECSTCVRADAGARQGAGGLHGRAGRLHAGGPGGEAEAAGRPVGDSGRRVTLRGMIPAPGVSESGCRTRSWREGSPRVQHFCDPAAFHAFCVRRNEAPPCRSFLPLTTLCRHPGPLRTPIQRLGLLPLP